MTTDRPQVKNREAGAARGALRLAALFFAMGLAGCAYSPSLRVSYAQMAVPYDRTQLRTSTTLDVLNLARDPAYQIDRKKIEAVPVTQSDTAVAFSGRSQDGLVTWLNLVVFDEYRMTAQRKYFFCIDERAVTVPEKPNDHLIPPRKGILFYAGFVLDPEVLTTPYATEEARRIALIHWLAEQFQRDLTALTGRRRDPTQGNKYVEVSGMTVRQMFQGLLAELDRSPDLARNLDRDQGVEFPHMSLGEGRICMLVENDTGTMKIRVNLPMSPATK
jgi:hypothetical protein